MAPKTSLYVGGLSSSLTAPLLKSAFLPFGDVRLVDLPFDSKAGVHKGFAFVTFERREDAEEALFNMNGAEILDRAINCRWATGDRDHKGSEAVWKGEAWLKEHGEGGGVKEDVEMKDDNVIE